MKIFCRLMLFSIATIAIQVNPVKSEVNQFVNEEFLYAAQEGDTNIT